MTTWTLDRWFAARDLIRRVYDEELGRDVVGDPDALANWLFHLREEGADEATLRADVRASDEWKQKHLGAPLAPTPITSQSSPIQVTDARDGVVVPRSYDYWAQAYVDPQGRIVVFFGCQDDGLVHFNRVTPSTGAIERLGALLPYIGTGEGWRWNAAGKIYLLDGPRLRLVDPFNLLDNVVVFDISTDLRFAGCDLWQSHSSDDGAVHSATVRQKSGPGQYPYIGTVVFARDAKPIALRYFPATDYSLDESAIDASGRWLLIKSSPDDDNILIDLATGAQQALTKKEGALGHSDMGAGFAVGADRNAGCCAYVDLAQPFVAGRPLVSTWTMGAVAIRGDVFVRSDATNISRVALDGSGETVLLAHGMVNPYPPTDPRSYDYQVRANISPDASVACYMTNRGTDRQDVFLLVL